MTDSIASISDKVIKNRHSTVQLIAEDIVFVFYHENAVLEPEDFDESLAAYNEISQGRKIKALSEFGKYSSATAEARKHAETLKINCIAEAAVFHSLAQRLLLKFYILFRKQPHTLKIFQSKEEALMWLENF
ncbi:MAG: hypothetical protein H6582_08230 [Crocinitomicaceae bacterium]|nr:hypothetical protein [Crocinitomicaceae bacterium]